MAANKKTAQTIGILFIIATMVFGIGNSIVNSHLDSSNTLGEIYQNKSVILAGFYIELIGVLAIPFIAIVFFPILKRLNEKLAISYIVLRTMEAVFLILSFVTTLSLIDLSQRFITQSDNTSHFLQSIQSNVLSTSDWLFFIAVSILFPLNALILNHLLYKSRLVPRVISIWGIIGALILMIGAILISFDIALPEAVLFMPIAIQEMVFAVWLIIKGFNLPSKKTV